MKLKNENNLISELSVIYVSDILQPKYIFNFSSFEFIEIDKVTDFIISDIL
ncbi:hypothetical protein LBMAG27_09520 [Bacteroidota bacterium]|nr:hypothetical protein LBMAG27_09520 [Bacteroidota bacterium]